MNLLRFITAVVLYMPYVSALLTLLQVHDASLYQVPGPSASAAVQRVVQGIQFKHQLTAVGRFEKFCCYWYATGDEF